MKQKSKAALEIKQPTTALKKRTQCRFNKKKQKEENYSQKAKVGYH